MITKTQEQGKGVASPTAMEKIDRFMQRLDPWIRGERVFVCYSVEVSFASR